MTIIETLAAQGEVRIFRIDAIPADAKITADHVIGHSETGHDHVLVADRAQVYQAVTAPEGMRVLYALLESPGELRHLRDYDTHAPSVLEAGAYMFRCDREYDHYAELARASAD